MSSIAGSVDLRPPFRWTGSKYRIRQWVVGHLALIEHSIYVEPFCGTAIVGMSKPPVRIEVFNDTNKEVSDFFEVIRTPDLADRLRTTVALTGYARAEYELAQGEATECDIVERTRRFLVRVCMSHSTKTEGYSGFDTRINKDLYSGRINYWRDWPGTIQAVIERLRGATRHQVIIENTDYERVLEQYDRACTLFYCDPPYWRDGEIKGYGDAWSREDHIRLARKLARLEGKVVISGYPSRLYDQLYTDYGWEKHSCESYADSGAARTESLWINTSPTKAEPSLTKRQLNLFQRELT